MAAGEMPGSLRVPTASLHSGLSSNLGAIARHYMKVEQLVQSPVRRSEGGMKGMFLKLHIKKSVKRGSSFKKTFFEN